MARNDPLEATLTELRAAGFKPDVTRERGHWKVKCPGLPLIACSVSPSDINATRQAIRLVRKIIARALTAPS